MKSDTQIKEDVEAELAWDPSIDTTRVAVAVREGIVTLSGTVPTYTQKWAVERAARRVSGLRGMALEMTVTLAPGHQRTDEEVAQAAANALQWYAMVPADRIHVEVEKGWVTLKGSVDWLSQAQAAERAVAPLMGVRGVTNDVEVHTQVDSARVRSDILGAFTRHAQREAQHIRIDVDAGVVTLSGRVGSLAEHDAAIGTARSAAGVRSVVDRLMVSL